MSVLLTLTLKVLPVKCIDWLVFCNLTPNHWRSQSSLAHYLQYYSCLIPAHYIGHFKFALVCATKSRWQKEAARQLAIFTWGQYLPTAQS